MGECQSGPWFRSVRVRKLAVVEVGAKRLTVMRVKRGECCCLRSECSGFYGVRVGER